MKPFSEFTLFILDQLTPFAPITVRRMFGADCLFRHGNMFAIIVDDTLYLKADDDSRSIFVSKHCEKFYYLTSRNGIKKRVALNYYELPETALENGDELCYWANLGILASQRHQKKF